MNTATPQTQIKPTVAVGDIFEMSWGYDQTNVDYFQVVRLTPKGVYVREIGAEQVPGTQGFMCATVRPVKDKFLDRASWCRPKGSSDRVNVETFRKISFYRDTPGFNFEGRYFARRVSADSTTYNSWYA